MPATRTLAIPTRSHLAVGFLLLVGCGGRHPGSYLPVGARALYGDATNDGVTVTLPLAIEAAEDTVLSALRGAGYSVETAPAARVSRQTASRALGGDSTLVVTAELSPTELSERMATVVVLTATVSVPSQGVRQVPVIQRPGETNVLYGQLQALGTRIRQRVSAAAP